MVAVKDQKNEINLENVDLPTGTSNTIIAPVIDMVIAKEAQNINFENVPSYSAYLQKKPSTGAMLKLFFKNHRIEQLFDHVRHYHQGDEAYISDQHKLVEEWKTIRHPGKNESPERHASRLDAFVSALNSLNARINAKEQRKGARRL